jgi:hypothetical protein
MASRRILAIFLLVAMCFALACGQGTAGQLRSQGGEITFDDPGQGLWRKIFYSNGNVSQQLFPEDNSRFDEGDVSDFSQDKKYLKINKIIRGVVQGEDFEEEYERAYCAFVVMASGCIVRQETGSFCGGKWGDEGDAWVWGEEEISIDERDQRKALSDTDIERLSEIGGKENVSRCAGQQ